MHHCISTCIQEDYVGYHSISRHMKTLLRSTCQQGMRVYYDKSSLF